jgi:hypothetical protein
VEARCKFGAGEPIAVAPYRRALGGRQCDTSFEKAGLHSGLARLFALFGRQPSLLPADGTGTASSRARSRTAPSAPPRYCISHGGLLTRMVLDSLSSHFPNQCPMWRTQNSGRLKMLSMGLSLPSALPLVSKSPGPLPHTSSTPSCDPNVHVFAGISLPAFCP